MAKRRKNPLAAYGYPGDKTLRRRAKSLAAASLPTEASIRRQYQRQLKDVGGFGTALVSALQGQQSATNGAWSDALAQQQQLAAAARAELGGLGPDYAGAQVAGGAAVDAGTSRVLQDQAAASQYGAALPGVGAARTHLAQLGVTSAQNDALTQRKDAFRQATMQAFQQLQQNAQSQALSLGQMDQSARQFQQNMAFQKSQAREQQRQFNAQEARMWASMTGSGGSSGGSSGGGSKSPWTATQVRNMMKEALGDQASGSGAIGAMNHGVPVEQFLHEAIVNNQIPKFIAFRAIKLTYGSLKGPNASVHPNLAAAYQSYQDWLRANFSKKGGGVKPPRRGGGRTRGGRK